MSEFRAALFDVDGVTNVAPRRFSEMYAEEHGLDPASFKPFFEQDFQRALVGTTTLPALITANAPIWQWDKPASELLHKWFEAENHPNLELLEAIRDFRIDGLFVALATNQEQQRTFFLKQGVFGNTFDYIYASCEVNYLKTDANFWKAVLSDLKIRRHGLKPEQIAFFDDEQPNIDAAQGVGIKGYIYEDVDQVKAILSK